MAAKSNGKYKVPKTTRLVNLIFYLADKPNGATSRQIFDEVSGYANTGKSDDTLGRQLRRDRDDLSSMGFSIRKSDDHSQALPLYTLDIYDAKQQSIDFSQKEVSLLTLCARNALSDPAFFLRSDLASALEKLRGLIGQIDPNAIEQPDEDEVEDAEEDEAIARAIDAARRDGCLMVFDYRDASANLRTRRVFPIAMFRYLGDMYVLAFDADRMDTRRFRFDRIAGQISLEPMSREVAKLVAEHQRDDLAVLPFQLGGQKLEGKIYFGHNVLYKVPSLTMGRGELAKHGEGMVWTVDVADAMMLARWSVENGPGILILQPEESARAVEEGMQRIIDTLGGDR